MFLPKRSADLLSGGLIDQGHFYIAIASSVIERQRDAVAGGELILDAVQLVDRGHARSVDSGDDVPGRDALGLSVRPVVDCADIDALRQVIVCLLYTSRCV